MLQGVDLTVSAKRLLNQIAADYLKGKVIREVILTQATAGVSCDEQVTSVC